MNDEFVFHIFHDDKMTFQTVKGAVPDQDNTATLINYS